jgi:hypothetical protein
MSDQGRQDSELLYFNGIDGTTGSYLIPPMPAKSLANIAMGERWKPEHLRELEFKKEQRKVFALKEDSEPNNLAQAGWGVIFAAEADPKVNAEIREALSELLDHRKAQAGSLYREFLTDGFYRHESKDDFLRRHGAGPGPVNPIKIPFYLLIVGDPQSIPYRFQYELDVAYAVGRIHFNTLDEYAQYARSVVLAEAPGKLALPRQAVFVGVANPDDQATNLSAQYLIEPLVKSLKNDRPTWEVQHISASEATKNAVLQVLGGDKTGALIFTASHGMGFPHGEAQQFPYQGALLCQDWPGPTEWHGKIPRDFYLAAEDIKDDAKLLGTIIFHFACYSAGTPHLDDFAHPPHKTRAAIAPYSFLAALPRRLLSHPKGGALAVVGHVERAWTYSFKWKGTDAQTGVFESMLKRLMGSDGSTKSKHVPPQTIGWALDWLNIRYSEIATMLNNDLEQSDIKKIDPYQLAGMWTAHNDARGYAIIGDPAVRLPVVQQDAVPTERATIPKIKVQTMSVPPVLVSDALPTDQAIIPEATITFAGTVDVAEPSTASTSRSTVTPLPETSFVRGEDSLRQIQENLANALGHISLTLAKFAQRVAPLEVSTYVTRNIESTTYDPTSGQFGADAALRALTVIEFDGDMKLCVPVDSGQIDQELWNMHSSMVQQAQQNRMAMLKTVAEVVTRLVAIKTV